MRRLIAAVCGLVFPVLPVLAQIETMPVDSAPPPTHSPPPAAQAPAEPPPVLPQNPLRRAIEAAANGSGGMSYAGPSGAMNSSPSGSSCAVTCSLQPPEQYQVRCKPGFTAMCQCDTAPMAGCRKQ